MRIDKLRLTCKCGEVFDAKVVVDAPVSVAVASMRAVRCPKCGRNTVFLGGACKNAPPLSSPVEVRANWWRVRGNVGVSSETIYSAFTGSMPRHVGVPLDPDDFSRCRKLLDLIPEWRADLARVSARYPWFAPMIDRWDELDTVYDQESPSGTCPRLYKLLKALRPEGQ